MAKKDSSMYLQHQQPESAWEVVVIPLIFPERNGLDCNLEPSYPSHTARSTASSRTGGAKERYSYEGTAMSFKLTPSARTEEVIVVLLDFTLAKKRRRAEDFSHCTAVLFSWVSKQFSSQ